MNRPQIFSSPPAELLEPARSGAEESGVGRDDVAGLTDGGEEARVTASASGYSSRAGERAGSGYDALRERTVSAGKPEPAYAEIYDPERVKLTMELETGGLVEFRLPGMGGEGAPLVTKVDSPRRNGRGELADTATGYGDVGNGGSDVGNVGNGDGNVGNVGNGDGNVGNEEGAEQRTDTARRVLLALKTNPKMSAAALARDLGLSTRQVERVLRTLREEGKIVRMGGTRGSWKVSF